MAKVFIVQEPMRNIGGEMIPQMDFRPAAAYGELVVCLNGPRVALNPVPMVNRLREVLKDFCDDDFLLAAGDPSAIAVAGSLVAEANRGRYKLLKWDKGLRKYLQVDINLYPHRKED